jgi:hypothetical protein
LLRPARSVRFCLVAGAAFALAALPLARMRALAQVAPPPPPVPNATTLSQPTQPAIGSTPVPTFSPNLPVPTATPAPTPSPSPAPRGKHHRGGPTPVPGSGTPTPVPSPTPTSPAFATLDGTWEMQLQYTDRTLYSYLDLKQTTGGTIAGDWRHDGKTYPLEGTYDGRLFRFAVKQPTGDVLLTGYVEAASDMIGLVDFGKGGDPTPFTAEHRKPPARGLLHKIPEDEGGGHGAGGGGGGGPGGGGKPPF